MGSFAELIGLGPGSPRPTEEIMPTEPHSSTETNRHLARHTPRITSVRAIPVAGQDSMLLNLSGAHGPFFTRNIAIIEDDSGHTGIGEVPGGEAIRKTLDEAGSL